LRRLDPAPTMGIHQPHNGITQGSFVRNPIPALLAVGVCLAGVPAAAQYGITRFPTVAEATAESVPTTEPLPAIAVADETPVTAEPEGLSVPTGREWVDAETAIAAGVNLQVLSLAVGAIECAVASGDLAVPPTLTLIDYSRPSTEPRLWVFDLATGALRYRELVAHGKGTGENMATRFSDEMNSHQTSLGLFVTAETYVGSNGYSLRMDGLEPGFNGRARERAIVMHGAPYVNADMAVKQGRLGRSWGCPALREAVAREVIDFVRGGGVVFSYYPDERWLHESRLLNCAPRTPGVLSASATH